MCVLNTGGVRRPYIEDSPLSGAMGAWGKKYGGKAGSSKHASGSNNVSVQTVLSWAKKNVDVILGSQDAKRGPPRACRFHFGNCVRNAALHVRAIDCVLGYVC